MSKPLRWTVLFGIPILAIGAIFYVVHLWGLQHAKFMTGGEPHPANCFSCHLYLDQDTKMADVLDREYVSPFKVKSSPDGKKLFVTAQESDELIIIDQPSGKLLSRIPVGVWPHSITWIRKRNTYT